MIPHPPASATSFVDELQRFARDDLSSPSNSLLYVAAQLMKTASMRSEDYRIYKQRVLEFISQPLTGCDESTQRAFFQFILISQMVDEDEEVRDSLFHLFRSRSNRPVDNLFINIIAALLRTSRYPAAQLTRKARPIVLASFQRNPTWKLVPVIVSLMNNGDSADYNHATFLQDLKRLDNGSEFESKVKRLDSVWQRMSPSTDSISVLLAVRRADPAQLATHPNLENYEREMTANVIKVTERIVRPQLH